MNSSETLTFRHLALRYLASLPLTNTLKAIETRIHHLDEHLLDFFGAYAVNALTPHSVEKFVFCMEAAGCSDGEIQACLVTFRACMTYALDQHWQVNAELSQPVATDTACLSADTPLMGSAEFHDLYQSLVQDITSDLYH